MSIVKLVYRQRFEKYTRHTGTHTDRQTHTHTHTDTHTHKASTGKTQIPVQSRATGAHRTGSDGDK